MDTKQIVKVAANVSVAASERYDAVFTGRLAEHGIDVSQPEALEQARKIAGSVQGARELIAKSVTPEKTLDMLKSAAEQAEVALGELKGVLSDDTETPKVKEADPALDAPVKKEGEEPAK